LGDWWTAILALAGVFVEWSSGVVGEVLRVADSGCFAVADPMCGDFLLRADSWFTNTPLRCLAGAL